MPDISAILENFRGLCPRVCTFSHVCKRDCPYLYNKPQMYRQLVQNLSRGQFSIGHQNSESRQIMHDLC